MKKVLLLLILAMVMTTSAIAQNLLASYTFSGNAQDDALTANHGTVSDAVLTQDRFGFANNAYLFNGVNAYIEAPHQPSWNTDYTTVSFWINANSIPGQGEVYILSFGGWQERFKISLPNHGKLIWTTNYENGISDMDPGDANALFPNPN